MIKIKNVKLRNILNSEGKVAIEVEMIDNNNYKVIASSPSAIVPGRREAITKRNINKSCFDELVTEICNIEIKNQKDFDNVLNNYMKDLGSNICLPFSLAFARLMAHEKNLNLMQYISNIGNHNFEKKMPIPLIAIFSGGVHNKKEKGSIQNIMIAVNVRSFSKGIQIISEIYGYIENKLKESNNLKAYGASSGMIVNDMTIEEKFEMIIDTIKILKHEKEVSIAIDVAAEHFFENGFYTYQSQKMNSKQLNDILSKYIEKYNIKYIEDPFDSGDVEYWKRMLLEHKNIHIVGDDLFATQEKYINNKIANGIIIKMNQVGTLTGTIEAFNKAKKENMITCVSQRSIETEDVFMCDLAVALNSTYIKIGGPRRGDRIAKYNQLIRLEEEIL